MLRVFGGGGFDMLVDMIALSGKLQGWCCFSVVAIAVVCDGVGCTLLWLVSRNPAGKHTSK